MKSRARREPDRAVAWSPAKVHAPPNAIPFLGSFAGGSPYVLVPVPVFPPTMFSDRSFPRYDSGVPTFVDASIAPRSPLRPPGVRPASSSSVRIAFSVVSSWPSPSLVYRTFPPESTRYCAGHAWFWNASHVFRSLSWTTGYLIFSRAIARFTLVALFSNGNSGEWMPMIWRPSFSYFR